MNTLQIVPAPTVATAPSQWWPALHVKKGRKLYPITPEQCAKLREAINGNAGASSAPELHLYDETGARIGRVSYNGRVWLHDVEGDIEVPQQDRKTCAQNDANGWRDFIK